MPKSFEEFSCKIDSGMLVILSQVSGVCLRYELIIPWVNPTVHQIYRRKGKAIVRQWPLVQHLIAFCSCCRSAVELRRMTAPECSSGTCAFFWNSAPLCHVGGGKVRKKVVSQHTAEIWSWLAFTCLQRDEGKWPPNLRRQGENHLIRRPFQLISKKLKLCVDKSSI